MVDPEAITYEVSLGYQYQAEAAYTTTVSFDAKTTYEVDLDWEYAYQVALTSNLNIEQVWEEK